MTAAKAEPGPASSSPLSGSSALVVDDELQLQRLLIIALQARGCRVETAATGREALDALFTHEPDVVLLDLGLPDMDGVDVCRHIRRWSSAPIIVLTADGQEDRKVRALDDGADDYVTKPFSMPELLARVGVAARHRRALAAVVDHRYLEVGSLRIDTAGHVATIDDEPLELSPKSFALLVILARNAGSVMTHRALVAQIWGTSSDGNTQPLRTHVKLLRQALGTGEGRPRLVADSGVGYRLMP
jgi:two-component system, OmpR family, KDP operon response regulator KdpE